MTDKQFQSKKFISKISSQLTKLVTGKKDKLVSTIRSKFTKFIQVVKKEQKRALERLDEMLVVAEQSTKQRLKCPDQLQKKCQIWTSKASGLLSSCSLQSLQIEQLIKYINSKQECLLKSGQLISSEIKKHYSSIQINLQKQLNQIVLDFHPDFESKIEQFCSIRKMQLKSRKKKQTKLIPQSVQKHQEEFLLLQSQLKIEEDILSDNQNHIMPPPIHGLVNLPLPAASHKFDTYSSRYDEESTLSIPGVKKLNREEDLDKSILSGLPKTKKKQLKVPEKYQSVIQDMRNSKSQIIDLTGAQLGNATILQVLQILKHNQKAKTLKLIRNKLDDEIISQIVHSVLQTNIVSINLSQNLFTDRCIDIMLQIGGLEGRNITLSQNKINQRNQKMKIERLKKGGVGITL